MNLDIRANVITLFGNATSQQASEHRRLRSGDRNSDGE
jgi:hypothetical protein